MDEWRLEDFTFEEWVLTAQTMTAAEAGLQLDPQQTLPDRFVSDGILHEVMFHESMAVPNGRVVDSALYRSEHGRAVRVYRA
jgi:hypothetical protein